MTFYGFVLLLHIIAAVAGLGASFAMPLVMKYPKTLEQAKFSLLLNKQIEKPVKFGSIGLLVTGLILGFINMDLFQHGWYIASIIIYILVQPIVAGILPKKLKQMEQILDENEGVDIPDDYEVLNHGLRPYNWIIHVAAIVLIVLMTVKPF
ncbi:DUF2269 family protein [Bacillus sp. FJAT-49736]|uniref:DUF2269 family protein n=1 Tax=Bacillus sp. FJAT-49736 TaxID=2833582 RepID=UPI001BCA0A0E|nr:DUF2269 family protein [Bacillus sp. FJAT-49736]MBS4174982.1 DUF2269 family protein [Bacillus sp. FJAT-49736]